jgi:hypothetical protein
MKKTFLLLFSLVASLSFAQTINNYEYVSIAKKYDFQRSPDEYQLNTLLKCQLEEYGFNVFYNTDLIEVSEEDKCLFLKANVISKSNIFLFKFIVEFTDCNNSIIYQSEIGGSKQKDLHDAFNEALDGALKSTRLVNYKFDGIKREIVLTNGNQLKSSSEVEQLVAVQPLKVEQQKSEMVKAEAVAVKPSISITSQNSLEINNPPNSNTRARKEKEDYEGAQSKTIKKALTTAVAQIKMADSKVASEQAKDAENKANTFWEKNQSLAGIVLYAQAVDNGFQLVDSTPKIVLNIISTSQPGYYNANVDKKYGVVFMKNSQWVFEYFVEGKLISEQLIIKFCN